MKQKNILKETLYKHLILEFSSHPNTNEGWMFMCKDRNILLEKHGILPNIDEYIRIATNYFIKNINQYQNEQQIILTKNIFSNIKNCFFKDVDITFNYIKTNNHASINATTGFKNNTLVMKFNANGVLYGLENTFKSIFAHELTHVYENYMRKKNNSIDIVTALRNDGYFLNNKWGDNVNDGYDRISKIKYFLSKSEMNAYIASTREEILNNISDSTETVNDFIDIVENKSYTYNMFQKIGHMINKIINETNEQIKKETLNRWNNISKTQIDTYAVLCRIIRNKYKKRWETYITKISKLIYDIYEEKCCKMIFPSNNQVLKY